MFWIFWIKFRNYQKKDYINIIFKHLTACFVSFKVTIGFWTLLSSDFFSFFYVPNVFKRRKCMTLIEMAKRSVSFVNTAMSLSRFVCRRAGWWLSGLNIYHLFLLDKYQPNRENCCIILIFALTFCKSSTFGFCLTFSYILQLLEKKMGLLTHRFRYIVVFGCFLCLTSINSNYITMNFTFICMKDDMDGAVENENGVSRWKSRHAVCLMRHDYAIT